jgi:hypothetical protein
VIHVDELIEAAGHLDGMALGDVARSVDNRMRAEGLCPDCLMTFAATLAANVDDDDGTTIQEGYCAGILMGALAVSIVRNQGVN